MNLDWSAALALITEHKWLPLAIFITGYCVRITSDDSKFPLNIPEQWHPVTALFFAQVYGVLVAWPNWKPAVQPAMVVALAVLAIKAYYNGADPAWLKWLARVMSPTELLIARAIRASRRPPPASPPSSSSPPS